MTNKPRVLVLGSGFAGQGHAQALAAVGTEVVGMASRTASVVKQVAASLGIPYATTDWRQALQDLQPDIVAVATPGGAHYAPVMAALEQGCHVFCDKPLAATAQEAYGLYQKAEAVGVKTAYAASYCYMPFVTFAKELMGQGTIGEPREVECLSHYNLNPLIPFSWSHRLSAGGGRLNNNFTHKLAIVLRALEGDLCEVFGEARNDMPRAPVVPGVHDFRERREFAPESVDDRALEWAEADAEWSYTVLARIKPDLPHQRPVSALFKHSGLHPRFEDDFVSFYGSKGAIYIKGSYAQGPLYLWDKKSEKNWQELALPAHIIDSLPNIEDDTQRNWTCLASYFVKDIQGEKTGDYQTFKDGWLYQDVIENIRKGVKWVPRPQSDPPTVSDSGLEAEQ